MASIPPDDLPPTIEPLRRSTRSLYSRYASTKTASFLELVHQLGTFSPLQLWGPPHDLATLIKKKASEMLEMKTHVMEAPRNDPPEEGHTIRDLASTVQTPEWDEVTGDELEDNDEEDLGTGGDTPLERTVDMYRKLFGSLSIDEILVAMERIYVNMPHGVQEIESSPTQNPTNLVTMAFGILHRTFPTDHDFTANEDLELLIDSLTSSIWGPIPEYWLSVDSQAWQWLRLFGYTTIPEVPKSLTVEFAACKLWYAAKYGMALSHCLLDLARCWSSKRTQFLGTMNVLRDVVEMVASRPMLSLEDLLFVYQAISLLIFLRPCPESSAWARAVCSGLSDLPVNSGYLAGAKLSAEKCLDLCLDRTYAMVSTIARCYIEEITKRNKHWVLYSDVRDPDVLKFDVLAVDHGNLIYIKTEPKGRSHLLRVDYHDLKACAVSIIPPGALLFQDLSPSGKFRLLVDDGPRWGTADGGRNTLSSDEDLVELVKTCQTECMSTDINGDGWTVFKF
ncbi:hypothetical protein H2200_012766 [Cladophialophora chaetospira]|uniref:Uncharacterized protein n=1 Tax=Cladophialophora chaetospira TaxID=386627 RepID=A0AA38WWS7_9EURO|nr:hypothetical protein H2200_012766 [Cladophialophora chaetospira]